MRYMVMEKGLGTLNSVGTGLFRGDQPLLNAVYVMIKVIEGLSVLHAQGIVHGDVHPVNVLVIETDPVDVRLIGFGASFFQEERSREPDFHRPSNSRFYSMLSHWTIQGYRNSFRDDVYRALWIGAMVMQGPGLSEYCDSLQSSGPSELVGFKERQFIFSYPGNTIDILRTVPPADESAVRAHLQNALDLARSVQEVQGHPPYDLILDELRKVAAILTTGNN